MNIKEVLNNSNIPFEDLKSDKPVVITGSWALSENGNFISATPNLKELSIEIEGETEVNSLGLSYINSAFKGEIIKEIRPNVYIVDDKKALYDIIVHDLNDDVMLQVLEELEDEEALEDFIEYCKSHDMPEQGYSTLERYGYHWR